ncbi:MAG: hypothetical protein M3Y88_01125 [Chloroflexota bacterium]|nr:hypothetical protein [Chloroflexota bacterium]
MTAGAEAHRRRFHPILLAAPLGAIGVDAVYLRAIAQQGEGFVPRVLFVAGWIAAFAGCALVAAFTNHPLRRSFLFAVAASAFGVLGVVGLSSIGVPMVLVTLIAAVQALLAAEEAGVGRPSAIGWALLLLLAGVGALTLGFLLTAQ